MFCFCFIIPQDPSRVLCRDDQERFNLIPLPDCLFLNQQVLEPTCKQVGTGRDLDIFSKCFNLN